MTREEASENFRIVTNGLFYLVEQRTSRRVFLWLRLWRWQYVGGTGYKSTLPEAVDCMNKWIDSLARRRVTHGWTPVVFATERAKTTLRPTHLSSIADIEKELARVTKSNDRLRTFIKKHREGSQ